MYVDRRTSNVLNYFWFPNTVADLRAPTSKGREGRRKGKGMKKGRGGRREGEGREKGRRICLLLNIGLASMLI